MEEMQSASPRRVIRNLKVDNRSPPVRPMARAGTQKLIEMKIENRPYADRKGIGVIALSGPSAHEEESSKDWSSNILRDNAAIRSSILFDGEEETEHWPNPYSENSTPVSKKKTGLISWERIETIYVRVKRLFKRG